MLVLTVLCTLLLVAAYLAAYIDPRKAWIFAFPGLVFPAIYVAEVLLGLWWVVRWKKYAFGVAAVLLLGIGAAGRFYRPDLRKCYAEPKPSRSELVVMSYNVMGFNNRFAGEGKPTVQLIADLVNANNTDIVCFQELGGDLSKPAVNSFIPDLKYYKAFPYELEWSEGSYFTGLGIYSRYPIVASGLLPADGSDRAFSMWADIRIQRDTVRVFNNHLNSTYIDNDDIDYLSSLKFVSGERTRRAAAGPVFGDSRQTARELYAPCSPGRTGGGVCCAVALSGCRMRRLQRYACVVRLPAGDARSPRCFRREGVGNFGYVRQAFQHVPDRLYPRLGGGGGLALLHVRQCLFRPYAGARRSGTCGGVGPFGNGAYYRVSAFRYDWTGPLVRPRYRRKMAAVPPLPYSLFISSCRCVR